MPNRSLLRHWPLAVLASLLLAPAASGLAEFGIEGMGVVSTAADEGRASLDPSGQRIVWASNRPGGAGGWDLWQATLQQGRWSTPQPLALNGPGEDTDPAFSADGRWLYFSSDRAGGAGGRDLYRAAVGSDGYGPPENLGAGINTDADESGPALSLDGTVLVFARARSGHPHQLLQARSDGHHFADARPVAGLDDGQDRFDPALLADGRSLLFASGDGNGSQVWRADCRQGRYAAAQPLTVSFNVAGGHTRAPAIDAAKPGELLLVAQARAPRAGGLDLYRMKAPASDGDAGCLR